MNANQSLMTNTRGQRICLWSGPLFVVIFFIGFWPVAGFMPPTAPMMSAADIAAFYQANTQMIRLGHVIIIGASGLMMPFVALIAAQMSRIPGVSPAFMYTQLGAGAAGILLFIIPSLIWSFAAYFPARDPELTALLHGLGWMFFILPFTLAFVQNLAFGIAILLDTSSRPIFPRWSGYFNIWIAIFFMPGVLATFFKAGPFAWNGLFPFWLPASVFGLWFFVVCFLLHSAITRQELEQGGSPRSFS